MLAAIHEVPRSSFFPPGVDPGLLAEHAVELGGGRSIPPVEVVSMMLRGLELDGSERVLDIGSGSGYQAALLSRLAHEVVSVEQDEELAKRARAVLAELGCSNVRVVHADGSGGFRECAPYQGIVVGAAVSELPAVLIDQLALGKNLVIALGDERAQLVERLRKGLDRLETETLGACHLNMLTNQAPVSSRFPWAGSGSAPPPASRRVDRT